ncbi:fumarylacetoacetate hydrolase family protein [Alphaproteobacteria bacterium]|nr:fumarylacetoacetate hydrolase family protein [Alphaproteobacteria bacterium]
MNLVDEAASIILSERKQSSIVRAFPPHLTLVNEQIAYEVQDLVHEKMALSGCGPIAGYKIGCTTQVMQGFLGIDQPCAGSMNENQLFETKARFCASDYIKPAIECELAVVMGRDLVLASDREVFVVEQVKKAVAGVMIAIEFVDDRYDDFSALGVNRLIADDFFNVASIAGAPNLSWENLDLRSIEGRGYVNGTLLGKGVGGDILGDPLEALTWLANKLAERGKMLKAGDRVTLGSVVETYWVKPGDHIKVEFDGLAPVEVFVDD